MTALLIVLGILGYLAVGVALARLMVWRTDLFNADDPLPIMVSIFWGPFLPFAILGGLVYGLYQLIALPPARVRRKRRHVRLSAEVARLERELGIGGDS